MTRLHARLFILALFLFCVAIVVSANAASQADSQNAQSSCERLSQLKLTSAKVTLAQAVAAGTFQGPPAAYSGQDISAFYKSLPAFCRVTVTATPSSDSEIKIEVWMPMSGWNNRLEGLGNGGFAGLIDYQGLGVSMAHGYAATATDAGHAGSPIDAAWALGHPEKVADFGHRGIHEMTRTANAVVEAFTGHHPQRAYFDGCSDGGREALMEAQRYPDDYDGILAGAPAYYWTALLSTAVVNTQALTLEPGSFIPPAKIPSIAAAVNATCDALDGVRDGIINDPRQCHFDPSSMLCKGAENDKCLTAAQATALKKIYQPLSDAKGHSIFPNFLPGGEDGPGGWALWITGPAPAKSLIAFFGIGYFSNMVYEKADWDYRTFQVDPGLKLANEKTASALNATNPDLAGFKAHGGKLILYHGWDDPAIPPVSTVNYYQNVVSKMGQGTADSFVRLYMIPGMQHCGGGPGTDSFGAFGVGPDDPTRNVFLALEQWVEKGVAPGNLIASKHAEEAPNAAPTAKPAVVMTRPLCIYPAESKYKGKGDTNDAASFTCGGK